MPLHVDKNTKSRISSLRADVLPHKPLIDTIACFNFLNYFGKLMVQCSGASLSTNQIRGVPQNVISGEFVYYVIDQRKPTVYANI